MRERRWIAGVMLASVAVGCHSSSPTSAPAGPAGPPPWPSAGCDHAAAPAVAGERRTLAVGAETRAYLIDAPAVSGDRPLPLVLAFHGFRDDAAGLRGSSGLVPLAASGALVAIHPEGHEGVELLSAVGRGWEFVGGDLRDRSFVRALLDAVEAERCIDRRREFATGFSNGAFFANYLGCALSDRLAAIAPVAGAEPLDGCPLSVPLPVLLFHGAEDPIVPVARISAAQEWWRKTNRCAGIDRQQDGCLAASGCAADLVLCEGPQRHAWPADATARLWRFFQAHPKPDAAPAPTPSG